MKVVQETAFSVGIPQGVSDDKPDQQEGKQQREGAMAAALTGEATDVEMMGTETVESLPL